MFYNELQTMDTLTIKIRNNKAIKLIEDLEALDLIRVISSTVQKPAGKLSALLAGSITEAEADNMQSQLKQMRDEWQRDTY
ncbi:MAG: hypothetical protein ACYCZO_01800 [Daejeonella sp.]